MRCLENKLPALHHMCSTIMMLCLLCIVQISQLPAVEIQPVKNLYLVLENQNSSQTPDSTGMGKKAHLEGLLVDIWELWSSRTGIHIEVIHTTSYQETLNFLASHQNSIIPGMLRTEEDNPDIKALPPLFLVPAGIYVRSTLAAPNSWRDFEGLKIAAPNNHSILEMMRKMGLQIQAETFPSQIEVVEAVLHDAAIDACIVDTLLAEPIVSDFFNYSQSRYESFTIPSPLEFLIPFSPFVLARNTEIEKIVFGGLREISPDEFKAIVKKWYGDEFSRKVSYFSKSEQEWLIDHPVVSVTFDPDWYPIEYWDAKNKTFSGITADVFSLLEERTGLHFLFEKSRDFADAIERTATGEIDLITAVVENEGLFEILDVTKPYMEFPVVVVGRDYSQVLGDSTSIVAIPYSYSAFQQYVAETYPEQPVLLLNSVKQCYEKVARGEADLMLENIYNVLGEFSSGRQSNLQIIGITDFKDSLSIGTKFEASKLPLIAVLNRAIANITQEELNYIINAHISQIATPGAKDELLRELIPYGIGVILLVVIIWGILALNNIKRLKQQIVMRKDAEDHLRSIIENTLDGYMLLEPVYSGAGEILDFLVLDTNPIFYRVLKPLGITAVVGKTLLELDPDLSAEWMARYKEAVKSGEPLVFTAYQPKLSRYYRCTLFKVHATSQRICAFYSNITQVIESQMAAEKEREYIGTILDSIGDAVITTDAQGYISMCNPKAEVLFGFRKNILLGKHITILLSALTGARGETAEELNKILFSPNSQTLQDALRLTLIAGNGEEYVLTCTVQPLIVPGYAQDGFVLAFHDITTIEKTYEALKKSETLLLEAQDIAIIGSWNYYPDTQKIEWSSQVCQIFEYPADSAILTLSEFLTFIPDDEREDFVRNINEGLLQQSITQYPHAVVLKSGIRKYVIERIEYITGVDGTVEYVRGTVQDISAMQLVQIQLEEANRIMAKAEELARVGHWTYDPNTKQFSGSKMAAELFGIENYETISIPEIAGHLSREDKIELLKAFREYMRGGEQKVLCSLKRSGVVNYYMIEGKARYTLQGDLQAIEGYIQDVTREIQDRNEKLQVYESLHQKEREFLQVQKIEAIGRLAGGVAHDFNNLLHVILGYGELLEDMDMPEQAKVYISAVMEASYKARDIVRQLLLYSRKDRVERKVFNISEIISGFQTMLSRFIGAEITLITTNPDFALYAQVDKTQIEQVLMNLSINARDAMLPKGGTLTITSELFICTDRKEKLKGVIEPGEYVVIRVKDTGKGMDREIIDKMFDPFFTTKDIGKGTGLGLSAVWGILEDHEAVIEVNSQLHYGTEFVLYFPRVDESNIILSSV